MRINSVGDVTASVRGRRQDLGLSQAGLAARAGVSREWISAFEGGKSTVDFSLVMRIIDALGLSLELIDAESGGIAPEDGSTDLDALIDEHRSR